MTHLLTTGHRRWCIIILLLVGGYVYAAKPTWIRTLPKAENTTYRYDKADATGTSEESARNKALAMILLNAKSATTGLTVDTDKLKDAAQWGDENMLEYIQQMRIPMRQVCYYRQQLENGLVRVYVLCQVSVDAGMKHEFSEFRHCGSSGDDEVGQASLRPDEWMKYESNAYFFVAEEEEVEQGTAKGLGVKLKEKAKHALMERYFLKDTALHILIGAESIEYKKEAYAIAYIKRNDVLKHYGPYVKGELDICSAWLENMDSYMLEDRISEAYALWEKAQTKLEELQPYITFVETYEMSYYASEYTDKNNEIKKLLAEKKILIGTSVRDSRQSKVLEYIGMSEGYLKKCAIGDALRYLYAAQLILTDLGDSDIIKYNGVYAKDYIQNSIKDILAKVDIKCDGYMPQSSNEYKLSFRYNNEPISNISFSANANEGWSDILGARDGWSTIFTPDGKAIQQVFVRLDYRYEAEANFDPELSTLMKKYNFNYDQYAIKTIPLVQKQYNISQVNNTAGNRYSTAINQNVVADKVQKTYHYITGEDSARYHTQTLKVVEAIRTKNMDRTSLESVFTAKGFLQYQRMMSYGNPHVITTDVCKYLHIGEDVQCRSLPMTFSFTKGKKVTENVILVYNAIGKVDGIQFALDERAARNIMYSNAIDENSKLLLVHFMENYQTAFAFQDWDYVEKIFSDDAVIITGRVIKRMETFDDGRQMLINDYKLTRQSKKAYISRLRATQKEWINIKFGQTTVEQSSQRNMYGICLLQDYYSSNYGDHGYLFLLIDAKDTENPIIRVRTWQPESEGAIPFTMSDYDRITSGVMY